MSFQEVLKIYQKRLPNLSERNRSLTLLRLPNRQFIDIQDFDFLENHPAFGIIEDLIFRKKKILLCSDLDSRDKNANKTAFTLKNIERSNRIIQEESGAKNLLLGYPFVEGKFQNDSILRCPLLFFPVDLQLIGNKWFITFREGENIVFNQTFLLAYSHFNGLPLATDLLEFDFDDFPRDAQEFRTALYKLLEMSNLEIHFNQETFTDRLQIFQTHTKKEFQTITQTGKLKLMPQAVLGIFSRSDSYLMPDYEELIRRNVDDFFTKKTETEPTNEHETITPFPIDASQEEAIRQIKNGQSIVVQGPPGTGKSQLIANLIADSVAHGKRVLLVCQKRAALDVVYARLREKKIQNFAALVHDFQADRKAIYTQIQEQIELAYEQAYQKLNFEALQLERRFLAICQVIEKNCRELDEFKKALFSTEMCGIAVKELYLKSDLQKPFSILSDWILDFSLEKNTIFLQKLQAYLPFAQKLETTNYLWLDRLSFADFGFQEKEKLKEILSPPPAPSPKEMGIKSPPFGEGLGGVAVLNFNQEKNAFLEKVQSLVGQTFDLEAFEDLRNEHNNIQKWFQKVQNPAVFAFFQTVIKFEDTDLVWLEKMEKTIMGCFDKDSGIEHTLSALDLNKYATELQIFKKADQKWFSRLKWRIFAKERKTVRLFFEKYGLEMNSQNADTLLKKIQNRKRLEKNRVKLLSTEWLAKSTDQQFEAKIEALEWLQNMPQTIEREDFVNWFAAQKAAIHLKPLWKKSVERFLGKINLKIGYKAIWEKYYFLLAEIANWEQKKEVWKKYLSDTQIAKMWADESLAEKLWEVLAQDFESLVAFDKLRKTLEQAENEAVSFLKKQFPDFKIADFSQKTEASDSHTETSDLRSDLKAKSDRRSDVDLEQQRSDVEQIIAFWQNSWRISWIERIEKRFPILQSVSTHEFEQKETALQEALAEKMQISTAIMQIRAKEQICKDLEYNRLQNIVSYREVKHQVSKKRNIWALRRLLAEMPEDVFRLVPVWLASPETVSAIFPLETVFDLVVFDEASQCFAEKGIPAIYRGKQIMVAGDEQQLSPNDLYYPKWEEYDDETPELEIDSLLDLATRYLPTTALRGHYRSRSLDLIDFSNQYFYKGKLQLIPDYQDFRQGKSAIEFLKVEGFWEDNTNRIEAEAVVKLIRKLMREGETNIGVITFNFKQQELIQDLLEAERVPLPDELFIKNIENVQGDERNIIIFSVAYAPNRLGKMRLQFGLLNLPKGENRLNVAVTRAKERIYVVSSIFPHQLQTEDLTHEGAKMLKRYLQYALDVSEGRYKPTLPPSGEYQTDWFLKKRIKEVVREDTDNGIGEFVGETTNKGEIKIDEYLPFADLTVWENEEMRLILTDDNLYYEQPSSKAAHVYFPFLLKAKNWTFSRMYSRRFWKK